MDKNSKGNIIHIFEKENKKEFNKRIFDIEFNKGTTLEQVKKGIVDFGIEKEIYQDIKTELFYWRQSWDNIINKYSIIEDIDIKQIDKKRKLSISESESDNSVEYDSSVSNYHSDDSKYTKDLERQTKINRKRKIENSGKNNNIQQEKQQKFNNINTIDNKQIQIQQFYQKLLEAKKNIVNNNNDNFDICEDIELDISKETTYKEFNRKNKNNSLYLGFKSICKKYNFF
ncbi:hypothetical protein F8M41_012184 [Gigaspora margarita]|uniref:Uncharacterized protein n=1 Tax=Gigaspora margarita TaxID=4874 RepID=A0A8H3X1D0_GIGMA|nr:hypothetical protein F8M41_012184 [Gigaspora margarita]